MTHWLFSDFGLQSPLLWLIISSLATVATALISWRKRAGWLAWVWAGQWLLIPYLGLLMGALSPRLMGLSDLDWRATLSIGTGLLFTILATLIIVRISSGLAERNHSVPVLDTQEPADQAVPGGTSGCTYSFSVILFSGAEEFHWVFLRAAVWETLLVTPPVVELPSYWAIWIAAAIVVVETAVRRLTAEAWLVQLTALATTSILFLYTRNFWLCWILHAAVVALLATPDRYRAGMLVAPKSIRT